MPTDPDTRAVGPEPTETGCVTVGPLTMYYDILGSGPPLVLLHGGLVSVAMTFDPIRATLAEQRRTIAIEQQAHGHTADIDRDLTFEQMVDDTAVVMRSLGVGPADVFGFSDGGNVALGLAIRHPDLVRRLVIAGTNFSNDGLDPQVLDYFSRASPDDMPELAEALDAVAAEPGGFPNLLDKVMRLAREFPGWTRDELRGIAATTLVIAGDADVIMPEHAVETFRLIPDAQLAILSGTDHVATMFDVDRLIPTLVAFLDADDDDEEGEDDDQPMGHAPSRD